MAPHRTRNMEFSMAISPSRGLRNLRNRRDATNLALWYTVKRVRAGVKASFGDDSSQYEMFGSMVWTGSSRESGGRTRRSVAWPRCRS